MWPGVLHCLYTCNPPYSVYVFVTIYTGYKYTHIYVYICRKLVRHALSRQKPKTDTTTECTCIPQMFPTNLFSVWERLGVCTRSQVGKFGTHRF